MPWAAGKKQLTRALAIAVATWAKSLPWLQVARQFQCSWGTVAAAVAYVVAFGLARKDLSDITQIGVDEISRQKGHVYLTNVYDLKTGTLIWSGEGRTRETLAAFFDFFGKERTANLIGICCDMWPVIHRHDPDQGTSGNVGVRQVPHCSATDGSRGQGQTTRKLPRRIKSTRESLPAPATSGSRTRGT